MDDKRRLQSNSATAENTLQSIRSIGTTSDASKYNLRCNRSLSEKMTKKDFVYDIRRPLQTARKVERHGNNLIKIPDKYRPSTVAKIAIRSTIVKARYIAGGGDATMHFPVHRILNFECNFCHEQIATLFSLSTHVKFHRRKYCKKCYWILHDGETMERHLIEKHSRLPTAISTGPACCNRR